MKHYCRSCGAELKEGAIFCENCGAPSASGETGADASVNVRENAGEGQTGTNIYKCADGKYRWIYEMNLFKNPTVFLLLFKIFFFICLGILASSLIFAAFRGDLDGSTFLESLKVFGIALGGATALLTVSYLIYAAIMGGKYIVLFEMDEKGINHKQMPKEAEKAKILSVLTVLAGAARGSLTAAGAGIGAARTEMYSDFSTVKKVKPYRSRNLIKVNGTLEHNQVYCAREDFDFVANYITDRCPKLK